MTVHRRQMTVSWCRLGDTECLSATSIGLRSQCSQRQFPGASTFYRLSSVNCHLSSSSGHRPRVRFRRGSVCSCDRRLPPCAVNDVAVGVLSQEHIKPPAATACEECCRPRVALISGVLLAPHAVSRLGHVIASPRPQEELLRDPGLFLSSVICHLSAPGIRSSPRGIYPDERDAC